MSLEGEATFVFERGDTAAHLCHFGQIDIGIDNARLSTTIGENLTPWIDDQRVAVGIALIAMMATLIRC